MCNLSELIFERAWEAGWKQGWEQAWRAGWEKGREETRILILQMFLENGGAEEEAARIFEATPEELEKARLQKLLDMKMQGQVR